MAARAALCGLALAGAAPVAAAQGVLDQANTPYWSGGLVSISANVADHAGPLHVTINVYNDLFGYAGGIYTQPSPTSKAGHSSKLCDGILLRMLRGNILGYARGHGSSLCERWIERALAVVGGCL